MKKRERGQKGLRGQWSNGSIQVGVMEKRENPRVSIFLASRGGKWRKEEERGGERGSATGTVAIGAVLMISEEFSNRKRRRDGEEERDRRQGRGRREEERTEGRSGGVT